MEKEFNVKWRDVIVKKDEILEYLKKSGDYVSGEDLSKKLGISRSAVWKNVNSLRESGYVIESVTNRGYRLADTSDVLNEREISGGLKTKVFGKKLTVFPEIDSTNEEA
ncbi:MAG TPA: biotin--[acetyl-CoA-carboxylase] ligase, partial [Ruminococcaceae bacterium]|nr:biotin--[acetyl-CoA-carboxylase] ligase [Oscillospiraceae bacterium]